MTQPRADPIVETDARGSGAPVVLVPGGLTGWASWLPHAERLSATHRVIRTQLLGVALRLRGAPLPPGYGLRMERHALERALDEEGVTHAHVVGWSYGGGIALDPGFEASRRLMASLDGEDVSEDQLEAFLYDAGIVPAGEDARRDEGWPRWVQHRQSLRAIPAVYRDEDDVRRLASLHLPLLLFKGIGSTTYDRAIVDLLGDACPDTRVETLPGAHVLPIVSMDRFLAIVSAFLAAHPIDA